MHNLKISLVITVLNERQTLPTLLTALSKQRLLPDETIIIDGGSTDGSWEWLQTAADSFRVLSLKLKQVPGNRSIGRNSGILLTKHPLIAITDAGCIPQPDWLIELRKKALEYQLRNGLVSGVVVAGYYDAQPKSGFEEAVIPYVLVMPDRVNPHDFLPATRSMLLHKKVWDEVGGFDERLSDNEDYAFAHQIQRLAEKVNTSGYELPIEILFAPAAKVTWMPRQSIASFFWMIYRFARGDAQAGLWRPKVGLIFLRYVLGLLLSIYLIHIQRPDFLVALLVVGGSGYAAWSVLKNYRYVPHGWYWLPILQVVADGAVMAGSLAGLGKRFST